MKKISMFIACFLIFGAYIPSYSMKTEDGSNVIRPQGCYEKEYNLETYSQLRCNGLKEYSSESFCDDLKLYYKPSQSYDVERWGAEKAYHIGFYRGMLHAYSDILKMSKYGDTFSLQECTLEAYIKEENLKHIDTSH